MLLTPRGWAKSYLVTVGWVIQRLLSNIIRDRRERILIANATRNNAEMFLDRIKFNLDKNEFLRTIFSNELHENMEKESERWTVNEIKVHGNLITIGSVEGNLVSQHYHVIVHDDLVNEANVATAALIAGTIRWWRLAMALLESNGVAFMLGTRWSPDDLYGFFIREFVEPPKDYWIGKTIAVHHNENYHLMQMDCWEDPILETGSTYPTKYPEEFLLEQKKLLGDDFPGQYRNHPTAKGRSPFKREWIIRWDPKTKPVTVHTYMLIDPSGKAKETSDATGIVVADAASDNKVYITYGRQHMITDRALAEWILDNALMFAPDEIIIEDNKFNVIYELLQLLIPRWILRHEGLTEEQMEFIESVPIRLREAKPRGRKKENRIGNTAGLYEAGVILWPVRGAEDLEAEYNAWPSLVDNVLDAFAYLPDFLVFPSPEEPAKLDRLHMSAEDNEKEEWEQYPEEHWINSGKMLEPSAIW